MKRVCLILFGPPGSGKGTQANLLRQTLGLAHISTGEMLRLHVASADVLGRKIASIMQSGGLVPDELVNQMVAERIEQPDCEVGFILDGFPRTVNQAKLLTELLAAKGIDPLVIHLEVDYNVIIGRISSRRQCPICHTVYSVPPNAGPKFCDLDGSKLELRDDDREEVVRQRLTNYDRQTIPVLEYLKTAGYTCCDVDAGTSSPDAIGKQILGLIEAKYGKCEHVMVRSGRSAVRN